MKIIQKPMPAAETICGRQQDKNNSIYRQTKLCVTANCADGILLFHTLTGMLVLLKDEQDWDLYRDKLFQNWFLVPESFDEMAFVDNVLKIAKLLYSNKNINIYKNFFTILTTTDCNARCYYCYEAGEKKLYMSEETAYDIADYIIRESGGHDVQLRWFGGEPLMNPKVIDLICGKLKHAGVGFSSLMITNGYLFDRNLVKKSVNMWNLKKVQITLDGTSETYNKIKAIKESADAYSRVINNIELVRNAGMQVHIRLNVSSKNIPELMRLIDELSDYYPKKDGIYIYPSLIGDFKGITGRFKAENTDSDSFLTLKAKIKQSGFNSLIAPFQREFKFNACKADNAACEVILPDGSLCKCDHELYKDVCGSIYSKERNFEKLSAWREQIKQPECYNCALYPRCINLKKCALVNNNCEELLQTIRISTLKEQMIDAYNDWKETVI